MPFVSRTFSALARATRRPNLWSEVSQNNIDNFPTVTMFLRKDHYMFTGADGQRRLNNIKESYQHAETNGQIARTSIPFFLPHSIGLQNFKLSSSSGFIPGDVYAQSCFSLLINDRPCKDQGEKLDVLTRSGASNPELETNDNSLYYRCITDSHVSNCIEEAPQRIEFCSFVPGYDSMRIPERSIIDEFFLANKNKEGPIIVMPFKFSVLVASDNELGIDDEWSMIKDWANRKA